MSTSTFIELELPVPYEYNNSYGSDYWEVRTTAVSVVKDDYFRLYDDSNVYRNVLTSPQAVSNLFDSEADAHAAASYYYNKHGELYPYQQEWYDSLGGNTLMEHNEVASTTIQSEEMKF